MKEFTKSELKSKIMTSLYYNDSRMFPRYDDIDFYECNKFCHEVISELLEEKKISIDKDGFILPYLEIESLIKK